VDEACKQLDFHPRQHALEIKETILEAVDVAVEEHGMEFRWSGDVFPKETTK
jgi:hypothetical protein